MGEDEKALEILNMCQECVPKENFPYDMLYYGFTNEAYVAEMIKLYYALGERQLAEEMLYELMESLSSSADFFMQYESTSEEYDRIMDMISRILDAYLDDVYDLLAAEDKEKALENLERAYSWVSFSQLPTDSCWLKFILYYTYLDPMHETAQKIAREYADVLIDEYMTVADTYESVYSSYVSAYKRYQTNQSQKDAELVMEYKDILENLDNAIYNLQLYMEQLSNSAASMNLTDVVNKLQELIVVED